MAAIEAGLQIGSGALKFNSKQPRRCRRSQTAGSPTVDTRQQGSVFVCRDACHMNEDVKAVYIECVGGGGLGRRRRGARGGGRTKEDETLAFGE